METVRRVLDLGVVDILGQSWGGVLGLEYVLRHPDNVGSFIAADTAFDLPRMQRGFDRKKDALGAETVTMMARHEAEGTTAHPEYQAAVTLLMHRHLCRIDPWPESLLWCMNNIGEDVFVHMFGPYFFQCTGTLRTWDRMDDLHPSATSTPSPVFSGGVEPADSDEFAQRKAIRGHDGPDPALRRDSP